MITIALRTTKASSDGSFSTPRAKPVGLIVELNVAWKSPAISTLDPVALYSHPTMKRLARCGSSRKPISTAAPTQESASTTNVGRWNSQKKTVVIRAARNGPCRSCSRANMKPVQPASSATL